MIQLLREIPINHAKVDEICKLFTQTMNREVPNEDVLDNAT